MSREKIVYIYKYIRPNNKSSWPFWVAPVSSVFRLVNALFIKLGMGISPSLHVYFWKFVAIFLWN